MVARDKGWRMGNYCLKGHGLHFYKIKRLLEMDGGDGCNKMKMVKMEPRYVGNLNVHGQISE